jgi:transketolase
MTINKDELKHIARTVRVLTMDTVQKANSGHPGMPMGLRGYCGSIVGQGDEYNCEEPAWVNRDRFILSAGHGSALLYTMLHLSGYGITIDDMKQFRQMGSITPGHPEFRHTPGVETTTGPLGQGFANGVGMAIAEKLLAEEFNAPGNEVIVSLYLCHSGDGCIMEGCER